MENELHSLTHHLGEERPPKNNPPFSQGSLENGQAKGIIGSGTSLLWIDRDEVYVLIKEMYEEEKHQNNDM